jgi:hypothetical protein
MVVAERANVLLEISFLALAVKYLGGAAVKITGHGMLQPDADAMRCGNPWEYDVPLSCVA